MNENTIMVGKTNAQLSEFCHWDFIFCRKDQSHKDENPQ